MTRDYDTDAAKRQEAAQKFAERVARELCYASEMGDTVETSMNREQLESFIKDELLAGDWWPCRT